MLIATENAVPIVTMRTAALRVVGSAIGEVNSTADLVHGLHQALATVRALKEKMPHGAVPDELEATLSEMLLLVADRASAARVRLASSLRRVLRPDLATVAATEAVKAEPQNAAGYVSLAASHLDAGRALNAREALDHSPQRNEYWYVTESRLLRKQDRKQDAVASAGKAVRIKLTTLTKENLAYCALAAGDDEAWNEADGLEINSEGENGPGRTLLLVLAGETLFREGDFAGVQRALEKIGPSTWARVEQLRIALETGVSEARRSGS